MLLELLAAEDAADEAWSRHRWALLSSSEDPQSLDVLLERREEAIREAAPAGVSYDAIGIIDSLVGDLTASYPSIGVDLDLPQRASIAAAPEVLRTILAEVLQNAVDELVASRRQRLQIVVHADTDDVLIDVIDDGDGVGFANPYAVFKPNRSLRAGARGRGLFDAEQLARRIDGQLVLMAHAHGGVLNGAHFRMILPRGTV